MQRVPNTKKVVIPDKRAARRSGMTTFCLEGPPEEEPPQRKARASRGRMRELLRGRGLSADRGFEPRRGWGAIRSGPEASDQPTLDLCRRNRASEGRDQGRFAAVRVAGVFARSSRIVRKSGDRFPQKRCENKNLEQAVRFLYRAACSRSRARENPAWRGAPRGVSGIFLEGSVGRPAHDRGGWGGCSGS